jgi:hypothetical protein
MLNANGHIQNGHKLMGNVHRSRVDAKNGLVKRVEQVGNVMAGRGANIKYESHSIKVSGLEELNLSREKLQLSFMDVLNVRVIIAKPVI